MQKRHPNRVAFLIFKREWSSSHVQVKNYTGLECLGDRGCSILVGSIEPQITYRDLKPCSNLLDEDENAYLGDFGNDFVYLAKRLSGIPGT